MFYRSISIFSLVAFSLLLTLFLVAYYVFIKNSIIIPEVKLASALSNGKILIWDIKTGKKINTLDVNFPTQVGSLVLLSHIALAACYNDRKIRIWDLKTNQNTLTLDGHSCSLYSLAKINSSYILASDSADKQIKIIDINTKENIKNLTD